MDGERLNEQPSDYENNISYVDVFEKSFPYYLSIGMTEKQYWDKDCTLVRYYRKAEELRNEKFNQQAWLQGMYFYDALARISPILHAYAKKGTRPKSYVEQPYPISRKEVQKQEAASEKLKSQKGMLYMQTYMLQNNKRFKEGE